MKQVLSMFPRPWETPELTHINRLPARATLLPFKTSKAALTGKPSRSPWVLSLNGEWSFKLFCSPEEVTPASLETAFDDAKLEKVKKNLLDLEINEIEVYGDVVLNEKISEEEKKTILASTYYALQDIDHFLSLDRQPAPGVIYCRTFTPAG